MSAKTWLRYLPNFFQNKKLFSLVAPRLEDSLYDLTKPEKIPLDYWKKVIWVALDLKKAVFENDKKSLKLLESNHVTLLFGKPHVRFQLAFSLACDLLGLRKTMIYDPNFENQPNLADTGRILSMLTDMFVIHGLHHDALLKLTSNRTVPVFSASCNIYCLHKALSDIMTFQEKFCYIKGLTLAWVGHPTSIFNTYLCLCSQLEMNIHYFCICVYGSGKMSPVHKFSANKCGSSKEHLKEFKTVKDTVTGAHIVATSLHSEERCKINLELLQHADKNWCFMHTLPRSSIEVTDDVFNHPNNLSWETSKNYLYIAMAILLTNLKEYHPKIEMPNFEVPQNSEGSSKIQDSM